MKRRLIIYFHYHPTGQADTACRFAVQKMTAAGEVYFVHNGTLTPEAQAWAQSVCQTVRQRPNTGFDVAAYRDAVLALGAEGLARYDEVILMNYTLAGPVGELGPLFAAMDARPELDFWGLTRHAAMHSRRFGGVRGRVPEHLQSHFLAVRPRMYGDFLRYWQGVRLPKSYEEAVRFHETRFTAHFSALGYRWGSFVPPEPFAGVFVNPIMACPCLLLEQYGCPFFKRRSFFTPYADELRRTDGRAAGELYEYLKERTAYPIDALIADLLPTQPLSALAQNLHWHYLLPEGPLSPAEAPISLDAAALSAGCRLEPDKIYRLPLPALAGGAAGYYLRRCVPDDRQLAAAAQLLRRHPGIGVLGSALPPYPDAAARRAAVWRRALPAVRQKLAVGGIQVPLEQTPPPLPNGGVLLVRGGAFARGLPPLREAADFWLVPLLAQSAGFGSAVFETAAQCAARAAVLDCALDAQGSVGGAAKALGRAAKAAVRRKREDVQ